MQMVNNFNADEKIMRYLDKLDYFFNGHKTLIVTELDLTNRCNNRCPGCCGVNENGAELSRRQVDLVISSIADMGGAGRHPIRGWRTPNQSTICLCSY